MEIWADVRRVFRLAVPVVFAELGWMMMTTVDTIMVGRLGPTAIGATGIGSSAYYSFGIFGMGLLLGLDTLVSQAFGARNREECHRWLTQGFYLALFITFPLMLIFFNTESGLVFLKVDRQVTGPAGAFVRTLGWGTLPLLLYTAFRRYLQAMGHVRPVMFVLLSANLVNWFFNWLLIQGHWGFPALGVVGSALSTCVARVYMALALGVFIWWFERGLNPGFRNLMQGPNIARLVRLLRLGGPAATQILLEVGAFGAAAILAGRLTPIALAAHQLALNCAALSYMVPLGISSAAAVAVGHAIGGGDRRRARMNGYVAIAIGCAFMSLPAAAFLLIPEPILRVYTLDTRVLTIGVRLLAVAALFQLFDGLQTVATGALRGLGHTREAMLVNLLGYWALGLPLGYWLCFDAKLGIQGIWLGLTLALVLIAVALLTVWRKRSRETGGSGDAPGASPDEQQTRKRTSLLAE